MMASSLSGSLAIVARTDPGVVRTHNEDAVFGDPLLGLVILADGMGGYNAGEVASGMAITTLVSALAEPLGGDAAKGERLEEVLRDGIARTNMAIFDAAAAEAHYAGMGTTLVAGIFHDNQLIAAHVGDSRLYRLRGDELKLLTHDHSLLQEQIDAGLVSADDARHSKIRNLVTRAVGVDALLSPEIHRHEVRVGDLYLFCSDGLNDMVEDDEIGLTLRTLGANLELAATQLIDMANDNGGRDNVSVILVRVLREFPGPQGWWTKLLNRFKQGKR